MRGKRSVVGKQKKREGTKLKKSYNFCFIIEFSWLDYTRYFDTFYRLLKACSVHADNYGGILRREKS